MSLKVHLTPSFYLALVYGGLMESTYQLCKALVRNGCEVRVLTTDANGPMGFGYYTAEAQSIGQSSDRSENCFGCQSLSYDFDLGDLSASAVNNSSSDLLGLQL